MAAGAACHVDARSGATRATSSPSAFRARARSSSRVSGLLETQLPDVPLDAAARRSSVRGSTRALARDHGRRLAVAAQRESRRDRANAGRGRRSSGVRLPWWNVDGAALGGGGVAAANAARYAEHRDRRTRAAARRARRSCSADARGTQRSCWPIVSVVLALAWLATVAALVAFADRARRVVAEAQRSAAARSTQRRRCARSCAISRARAPSATPPPRGARCSRSPRRGSPNEPPRSLGALAAVLPEIAAREVLALEAHIYGAVRRRLARRRAQSRARRARTVGNGAGAAPRRPVATVVSLRPTTRL